jgi:UDP-N-acetylmuramoyl-L-alanyl-D-glutamate--2,6-diaminopimelate ligase
MEISSHALAQHRVDGLTVDVAGFTNLSQDHLDYHGTMEDYFAAKAMLFTPPFAHRALICTDDAWGRRLAERAAADGVPTTTVNTRVDAGTGPAAWQVVAIEPRPAATVAEVLAPDGRRITLTVPLPGAFNLANALLATAMLTEAYPIDPAAAAAAVAQAGPVPGRMERVEPTVAPTAAGAPVGVVDYAHTPDAVAAALTALRAGAKPLVVVLGAGGDRDRAKRPVMGAAAAAVADVVIVTDDNPRSEDPATIRAAVLDGARSRATAGVAVREVPDRREAIAAAVESAWTDAGTGVVLVAGKGHEQGQELMVDGVTTVHPFDDRLVLREALGARGAAGLPGHGRSDS